MGRHRSAEITGEENRANEARLRYEEKQRAADFHRADCFQDGGIHPQLFQHLLLPFPLSKLRLALPPMRKTASKTLNTHPTIRSFLEPAMTGSLRL